MRGKVSTPEEIASEIASGQHGNVTRAQLLGAGISGSAIDRRLIRGHLIPRHRGVYRVGHEAPSTEATYMAAVLAAGEGAPLAGRAAAHLMRVLKGAAPPPEVLAVTERRIKGVHVTRRSAIDPRDATEWQGIPTTTVARSLVDLATRLPEPALARACHEAQVLYRTQPEDIEAVLARRPRTKGASLLRSIVRGETRMSLSKL